jgi:hypothetical protein
LLARNGIQYGYGLAAKSITGFDYFSGKTESYNVDANDLVINAYQPKAVLLNVLMEPTTFIADSAIRMILQPGPCLMPMVCALTV